MLTVDATTFWEFAMQEPLPLAMLQTAVLEFLRGRGDVVVFGAQAVNAYVSEPRMSQDIDLLAVRAEEMAHEIRDHLAQRFHLAVRVRTVSGGGGWRIYQVQKGGNRHLVDVRPAEALPRARSIGQVLVMAPADLIASKVTAYNERRGKPKAGTDWRDIAVLLLKFPELKREEGPVADCLSAAGVSAAVHETWRQIVATQIQPEEDEEGSEDPLP